MTALAFAPSEVIATVERTLVTALALAPTKLAPEMAHAESRGFVLSSRVHRAPHVRLARFVSLAGPAVDVGGALVLMQPELVAPIFGADFVRTGGAPTMLAIDLSPAAEGESALRALTPLEERRARHAPLPTAGPLPDFCAPWFSPWALFARIEDAHAAAARAAVDDFVEAFVALARAREAPPSTRDHGADAARARQDAYLAAHREGDPSRRMLDRLFGAPFVERYVREVLFPDA